MIIFPGTLQQQKILRHVYEKVIDTFLSIIVSKSTNIFSLGNQDVYKKLADEKIWIIFR